MRLALIATLCGAAFAQSARKATLRVFVVVPCGSRAAQKVEGGCLDKQPFLTQADVEYAEVHKGSKGQPIVFVTFRHDAAVRELNVTKQNIGNRVAIQVNGRIVATPLIPGASRQLFIEGGFTEAEAERVAAGLNSNGRSPGRSHSN